MYFTQWVNPQFGDSSGALVWRRGPVCACTRVCWCRRIFTYIHTTSGTPSQSTLLMMILALCPPPPLDIFYE